MPPMISASAMIAPPCMTSRRLHRSSRLTSSASLRSGERVITFTPMNLMKGEVSHAFMMDPRVAAKTGNGGGKRQAGQGRHGKSGALFQIAWAAVCCPAGR